MVLVTITFTVSDLELLRRTFAEREVLRERYGCVGARLLTSAESPGRVLCLMEFPTHEAARAYVGASRLQLDAEQHADIRPIAVEYFVPLTNRSEVEVPEARTA